MQHFNGPRFIPRPKCHLASSRHDNECLPHVKRHITYIMFNFYLKLCFTSNINRFCAEQSAILSRSYSHTVNHYRHFPHNKVFNTIYIALISDTSFLPILKLRTDTSATISVRGWEIRDSNICPRLFYTSIMTCGRHVNHCQYDNYDSSIVMKQSLVTLAFWRKN